MDVHVYGSDELAGEIPPLFLGQLVGDEPPVLLNFDPLYWDFLCSANASASVTRYKGTPNVCVECNHQMLIVLRHKSTGDFAVIARDRDRSAVITVASDYNVVEAVERVTFPLQLEGLITGEFIIAVHKSIESDESSDQQALSVLSTEMGRLEWLKAKDKASGMPALKRLVKVAQGDTGQSSVVGRFLLGLYNGPTYPFDLTDLRSLDLPLRDDCMAVLAMDYQPEREVHELVENGQALFLQFVKWYGAK